MRAGGPRYRPTYLYRVRQTRAVEVQGRERRLHPPCPNGLGASELVDLSGYEAQALVPAVVRTATIIVPFSIRIGPSRLSPMCITVCGSSGWREKLFVIRMPRLNLTICSTVVLLPLAHVALWRRHTA